jgi:hypothetical protein
LAGEKQRLLNIFIFEFGEFGVEFGTVGMPTVLRLGALSAAYREYTAGHSFGSDQT